MSRPLRLEFAGALYHVTARGNAREDIFRDDGDRATFLDLLGREIGPFGGSGAAYRRFVTQGIGLPSVWEDLRGQMWLGDEPFRAKMQRRLGAKRRADVSRAQRTPARPNPDELLAEVAKAFDLPRHAVLDRRHTHAYR
jgi:hypothetical protein